MPLLSNLKQNIQHASWKDLLYLSFLSGLIIFFLSISYENAEHILTNYQLTLNYALVITTLIIFLWLYLLSTSPISTKATTHVLIALSSLGLLIFIIPYKYFYPQYHGKYTLLSIGILLLGVFILHHVLKKDSLQESPKTSVMMLSFITTCYTLILGSIALLRHLNFQDTSSFDVAIYSQIQWNNIHGHWLESSTSGSNFVTHNSPFLAFLSIVYALYPAPETLLILKSIFIGISAIPFYLILKTWLNPSVVFPLTIGYLFYPFIIGQHVNAPHEMCYVMPFLLWSFYFFIQNKFKHFLILLAITLTIKEHLALLSICYGLYAWYLKKEKRWILTPLILGICWALFSLWLMHYFQKIYTVDPSPAWLIDNIKSRFLNHSQPILDNITYGLQTSNLGNFNGSFFLYLLLSPLLIILPFCSLIFLIGLPEVIINLMANVPIMYPNWHYNIVTACFFMLASAKTLKNSANWQWIKRLHLNSIKAQQVIAWFICLNILAHGFIWWDFMILSNNDAYIKNVRQALSLIPPEASVKAPKNLVAYVANRRDYFLLEDKRSGDFMIMDTDEQYDIYTDHGNSKEYTCLFHEQTIRLLKRNLK